VNDKKILPFLGKNTIDLLMMQIFCNCIDAN